MLKARLGSGGYGEVWEAEVPGGLRKALKFVYGRLDESRGQSELKSLNRIKEIGHPFLLSIERIEVVDGRLIIVTELAQGCLKARFDACRQSGLPGIPRDELLGYIRDTADALDFIHDRHGLQHLDVKPENLLMVGNHVKVADFGLVKDLKESLSSVGGLTALYCPPEVLNGRPSGHSDQYSLAIVYQEMLTGQLPFGGRTAAQLAAQHLHSPPMLAVLPPADQPVVARALSKNPDQRFPNCRPSRTPDRTRRLPIPSGSPGLVEQSPFDAARPSDEDRAARRARFDEASGKGAAAASASRARRPSEVRDLPRVDLETADQRRRPAIFVGVGGTGGRILSQLQHRLHEAFGNGEHVPAVQMLLLDTDSKDLSSLIFKRGSGSIPARNTLAIPLRAPKDYRADSQADSGMAQPPMALQHPAIAADRGAATDRTAGVRGSLGAGFRPPARNHRAGNDRRFDRTDAASDRARFHRGCAQCVRRRLALRGEPEVESRSISAMPSAKSWASCNCRTRRVFWFPDPFDKPQDFVAQFGRGQHADGPAGNAALRRT